MRHIYQVGAVGLVTYAAMDPLFQPSRRRYRDHVFVWDKTFTSRQKQVYRSHDNKLKPAAQQPPITAFLEADASKLDPPQYNFTNLAAFLERANEAVIRTDATPPGHTRSLAWLDDRCDNTGWKDYYGEERSARNWDEYPSHPPEGENIRSEVLDVGDLYRRLCKSVRETGALLLSKTDQAKRQEANDNVERRLMYV